MLVAVRQQQRERHRQVPVLLGHAQRMPPRQRLERGCRGQPDEECRWQVALAIFVLSLPPFWRREGRPALEQERRRLCEPAGHRLLLPLSSDRIWLVVFSVCVFFLRFAARHERLQDDPPPPPATVTNERRRRLRGPRPRQVFLLAVVQREKWEIWAATGGGGG